MEKILDEPTKRVLAVRASVDPRTIDKVFKGEAVRGMAGYRATAALRAAGLLPGAMRTSVAALSGRTLRLVREDCCSSARSPVSAPAARGSCSER